MKRIHSIIIQIFCFLVPNIGQLNPQKIIIITFSCTELQDFSNQAFNSPDSVNLCINHQCNQCINHLFNKVQLSFILTMIIMMDLHANFVEQILVKFPEEKQDVLLFYGVFAFYGQQDSCVVYHAVWMDARILNSSVQNVIKLKTQFQLIVVDLYQYFINFMSIYLKQVIVNLTFSDSYSQTICLKIDLIANIQQLFKIDCINNQYKAFIILLFGNLMLSTKNRRQCYTCVSKNRNNHQTLSVDHEQSFCNGQILLNTAKILKGNKKHLKQYQRNQNLKSRCSNKKNKNKSKSYFNSLAITADTTPRQQTILNSNLNLTMYHEKGHEFQIQQSKKPQAKSQTHFKQKMKMLTQNFCRKQFRKLHNNQQSKDKKNNRTILKQEIEDLSFRESAFSKELINYQNDQNRKPIPLKSNISKISTNSFQSINLQNRINQYMNVLIQKSEKDQLNILQTILTQRKDEQLEQIKLKEEKLLQKIRQRNAGFCKKLKMSNKNRLLKKTVNRNIQQNNRSKDRQSISPKYKSIDITWRDMIQENKTSQLPKNILKMHKSNQISNQTFLNGSNLMNNNFLKSFIDKKRLQIQI